MTNTFEAIHHANMKLLGNARGNADLRLAAREAEAGTQGLHTTRRQECPHTQGNGKKEAEPRFQEQDESILPGRTARVKKYCQACLLRSICAVRIRSSK